MSDDKAGYVYILTNPSFKDDWVKIGKSSRPVNVRSKELDNTAVPLPFEIFATLKTTKYSEAEMTIHNNIDLLTNLRIRRNREFFNVPPKKALEILKKTAALLDDAEITEYKDNKPITPAKNTGHTHTKSDSKTTLHKNTRKEDRLPEPAKEVAERHRLDEKIDMTGRHIASYSYKNEEYPVQNWIDFYVGVIKQLHEQDPQVLTSLSDESADERGLSPWFSPNPDNLRKPIQIAEGIYTEGNTSTKAKLRILTLLFVKYGEDPATLTYSLRTEEAPADKPYAQDQLEYWTYALPVIKTSAKAYSNVNPGARHFSEGYLGMRGYHLVCRVSRKSATIYLYIEARNTKAENTAAFDWLLAHRGEIENALGTELIWNRGENKKSAEIGLELTGVNVCNKDDHPQMAAFHAQWAQRFTEVFLPFLR